MRDLPIQCRIRLNLIRRRTCRVSVVLLVSLLMLSTQAAAQGSVSNQADKEIRQLEPGKAIEREIAGGQTHTYRIALQAGQFLRVIVEQKGINLVLALAAPNDEPGKPAAEVNLTGAGGQESLSTEAAMSGNYRLTVRATGSAAGSGAYQLRMEARAAATAEDRQRIAAERLLVEAEQLSRKGATTAQQLLEKSEQALALWRELGDRYWEAYTLNLLGVAYRLTNRHEKAIEYYGQSLQISQEIKNRAGEAAVLINLGDASRLLSRYEKALEYLEQALRIARKVKDRAGEGRALTLLGVTYSLLSQQEKAIEYWEQALAAFRELKDRLNEGRVFTNLGIAYYWLGHYEKAVEYHERALQISREEKNRAGEAAALSNLGIAYARLNRPEKAIEYYGQVLEINREVKDRSNEGNTLNNLGSVYSTLGRHEKAIEYFEQALVISREIKDRTYEGIRLSNIGLAYSALDRYEKAIAHLEQALRIAREVKNRVSEADALDYLGTTYSAMGRYEKALEYSEQSLTIQREIKYRFGEENALKNVGIAYLRLSRYDKAVEYFGQALAIARELKDRAGEAETLYSFAKAERERGDLVQARNLVEESLKIIESLRSSMYNPESRASYFASAQGSSELYTDLLMRLHKANPAGGFDALALDASERTRARGLLELLTEAGTDIRQGADPSLLERERALARQLNAKASSQAQLLSKAHTPEQATALGKEISQLENDYEQTQTAIRRASPRYAALTQPQPLKLTEIQQQLDQDTLLLEYSLGEERSYLWALTNNSLASYELPKEAQVKGAVTQVLDLLTARSRVMKGETPPQKQQRIAQAEAQLPEAARQLSQMLLSPVAEQLGSKRLVIVADGALQYVPFAALPLPRVSGQLAVVSSKTTDHGPRTTDKYQPLIISHEIISLPSASTLAVQRRELAGRKPAPNLLAVIADPVFATTDERMKTAASNASAQPESAAASPTASLVSTRIIEHLTEESTGGNSRILRIPRLPFTRREADQIIAVAPGSTNLEATDFKANLVTVTSGALSQYRYVHFATHGYLDSERPGLSALVFSMVDEQGKPQDGFLRANEIYNLNLPAELVVLSACQTGLGKEIKGEGLVGLTRGFMYAGAARVVVSLWSVNDKATSELMAKFYQKMLKENQRPAAALRAAQVELWKQKAWQSPYYWAAFVLQGEWK